MLGPAFAILTVYGRSCFSVETNSSLKSPPQIDVPPVPVPTNRYDYKLTQFIRCESRLTGRIASLHHETFYNAMENVIVVVAVLAVNAKVFHRFGTFAGKQFHVNVSTGRVYCRRIVDALYTCQNRNKSRFPKKLSTVTSGNDSTFLKANKLQTHLAKLLRVKLTLHT